MQHVWRRHFHGNTENFARLKFFCGIIFNELQLTEGKHGWNEEGSGAADQEGLQHPGVLFIQCIMHQQALSGKDLDISCVLKPVIFCNELNSESST